MDRKAAALDRVFHYRVPASCQNVKIGHRVLVPFRSQRIEAYVLEIDPELEPGSYKMRSILALLDQEPVLQDEQIAVARWMADYYYNLLSDTLQLFLPSGARFGRARVAERTEAWIALVQDVEWKPVVDALPSTAYRQREVLRELGTSGPMAVQALLARTGASYQTLASLERKAYVRRYQVAKERPLAAVDAGSYPPVVLSRAQEGAVRAIEEELGSQGRPILLHGVTSSGKTEVYVEIMRRILAEGRQVIVMVPEIALAPQTIARMQERFGDSVAVLHSGLSLGERFDQWWRIFSGQVQIVVGARSAVFSPCRTLGLLVLDEEHETTYKQEEGRVRYHARQVALMRARQTGAHVILGSATPGVESYHRALQGAYCLVELPERVRSRPMPDITMVDMRTEFSAGNRTVFSRALQQELAETLADGEQAMLLLNRRGFSSFVLCRECGWVIYCDNCNVSLTYHKNDHRLHCHYCSARSALPKKCPQCASPYLRLFGSGTQQVEEQVGQLFPQAQVIRMDTDTTSRKGAHQSLLGKFRRGEANVLIGTQMIAKGLDFPNVTLVGVLSADLSLDFPDFRASERTFQLLTQVAGRAGRGEHLGRVLVQSYKPDNYVLQAIKDYDYFSFYRREISFRAEFHYPPLTTIIRILISGDKKRTKDYARHIAGLLQMQKSTAEVIGPSPAPIDRIKGQSRWHLLLKTQQSVQQLMPELEVPAGVHVMVDVDPVYLL